MLMMSLMLQSALMFLAIPVTASKDLRAFVIVLAAALILPPPPRTVATGD